MSQVRLRQREAPRRTARKHGSRQLRDARTQNCPHFSGGIDPTLEMAHDLEMRGQVAGIGLAGLKPQQIKTNGFECSYGCRKTRTNVNAFRLGAE